MVRIAVVFALAASVEAARSSVEEIDALIAERNFKIADANFDYAAADALDFDEDFDEELAEGDFTFKESDQQFPVTWGLSGTNHCPGGSMSVSEFQCLQAAQQLLQGRRQGRRHLVAGSWRHVPPGCSAQTDFTHGRNGDNAAHYNRNPNGRNDGGYTPVCSGGGAFAPQGFNGGAMAGNVMVADGCRRAQGSRNPEFRSSLHGFASVRCCSNNGRRCETSSIGCLQHQTYSQAVAACSRRNMRLCSVQELDSGVCCGTGCGFDGHQIWTLSQAGNGFIGQGGFGININPVPGQFNGQHGFSGSGFNGGGFHNQISEFVVADGCSRSQGRQNPRTRNAISGRASVRCCSMSGNRCETQQVGCVERATYNEANQVCAQRGLRLCAQHELDRGVCCGTGCGFDGRRVWTSTPAR